MPKVRERSRIGQEFAVTPWQSRREEAKDEGSEGALYVVEEADLLAKPSGPSCPPTVPRDRPARLPTSQDADVDTTGWFTKLSRPEPEQPVSAYHPQQASPYGFLHLASQSKEAKTSSAAGVGGSGDSRKARTPVLRGFCQLAITPAGVGLGHIFVSGGDGTAGGCGARCYGLVLRPVPPGVPPDPCTADEGTDLLVACLTDLAGGGGEIVDVLVGRTGGDMCRLAPPEAWLLRHWFGDDNGGDSDDGEGDEEGLGRESGSGARCGADAGAGVSWWGDEEEDWEADWGTGEDLGEVAGELRDEGDGPKGWHEDKGGRGEDGGKGVHGAVEEEEVGLAGANGPGGAGEVMVRAAEAAQEWLSWLRRQRRRRPALELYFEPKTLLSGSAALPKLAEFARPLLPPRLVTEAAEVADAARDGGLKGQAAAKEAGVAIRDTEVDAVVCLGAATIRGLLAFSRNPAAT